MTNQQITLAEWIEKFHKIELQLEKTRFIVDHLLEGYFTIEPNLNIGDIATKSCLSIFGHAIANEPLDVALDLPENKAQFLKSGVAQYFENFMPFEVTISLLPTQVQTKHGRTLELVYTPVFDEQNTPQKLIVSVSDVTTAIAQRLAQDNEAKVNQILLRILRSSDAFQSFVSDTDRDLRTLAECNDSVVGKRILHTLKGNFSAFGFIDISDALHKIEENADEEIETYGLEFFFIQYGRGHRHTI